MFKFLKRLWTSGLGTKEIWKDIKGYEGIYQISNFGRVWSLERRVNTWNGYKTIEEKEIKPSVCTNGYIKVVLYKDNTRKNFLLHRLVAEHFLERVKGKEQVNHKDENKANNRADNLEWCTPKENVNYGDSLRKRAETQRRTGCQLNNIATSKRVWCNEYGIAFASIRDAGRTLGIDHSSISKVCKGKLKSIKGLTFNYLD